MILVLAELGGDHKREVGMVGKRVNREGVVM